MPGYRCCRRATSDLCAFCGGQQNNVYTAVFHDMANDDCEFGDCTDINSPESFVFTLNSRIGECTRWGEFLSLCGDAILIGLVWWKDGNDYKFSVELAISLGGVPTQYVTFTHNFGTSKPACAGYTNLRCDFVESDGNNFCDATSAYVLVTGSNP